MDLTQAAWPSGVDPKAERGSGSATLARAVATATPACPRCGHAHYVAEMDVYRGALVLLGLHCAECDHDVLAAFLALNPSAAIRRGDGWASPPV